MIINEFVIIKNSPIDGLGVFAKQDIKKGTKISDYYGLEMDWKTFKNKYGDYKNNSLYTYPMRRIWRIIVAKEEPYLSQNLVNYINEDINFVNCELKFKSLYSSKDIVEGEELFLKYPKGYNRVWLQK